MSRVVVACLVCRPVPSDGDLVLKAGLPAGVTVKIYIDAPDQGRDFDLPLTWTN